MTLPTDSTWVPFYNVDFRTIYGRELESYEIRIADSKPVSAYRLAYSVANNLNQIAREFELAVEVRKVKDYKPPVKKKPDSSSNQTVVIKEFKSDAPGKFGELTHMTRENRSVYVNSKGPYIKTRAEGRVPVEALSDGTYIARYINGRLVDKDGLRLVR